VLPDDDPPVGKPRPQVQIGIDDGPHQPPSPEEPREAERDRVDVASVVEIAAREDQVADARPPQVEVGRGQRRQDAEVVADGPPRRSRHRVDHGDVAGCQEPEFVTKPAAVTVRREPMAQKALDLEVAGPVGVGQRHEAVPEVAH
jgi:hypothetical protein